MVRGETDIEGGSECGQFCGGGALSLVFARKRSMKLAALTSPGGAFASLICFPKRSATEWSMSPGAQPVIVRFVRRAAAEWSGVGA